MGTDSIHKDGPEERLSIKLAWNRDARLIEYYEDYLPQTSNQVSKSNALSPET